MNKITIMAAKSVTPPEAEWIIGSVLQKIRDRKCALSKGLKGNMVAFEFYGVLDMSAKSDDEIHVCWKRGLEEEAEKAKKKKIKERNATWWKRLLNGEIINGCVEPKE